MFAYLCLGTNDMDRARYQPDFYAACVRDPDGHKLAAVCLGFTTRPSS